MTSRLAEPGASSGGDGSRRVSGIQSALTVLGFAGALVLTYGIAVGTTFGQSVDAASFSAFAPLHTLAGSAAAAFRSVAPFILTAVAVITGTIALFARQWLDVVRAVLIVVLSVCASEALKAVLPRPDLGAHGYQNNTLPSGHVAFALAMSVAVGVVAAHRGWMQIVFVLSVVGAMGIACASLLTYAHRPSDVLGAVLVVGTVASLVLWGRPSAAARAPILVIVLCLAGATALGFVTIGSRVDTVSKFGGIEAAGWFLACATAIGFVLFTAPLAIEQGLRGWRESAPRRLARAVSTRSYGGEDD